MTTKHRSPWLVWLALMAIALLATSSAHARSVIIHDQTNDNSNLTPTVGGLPAVLSVARHNPPNNGQGVALITTTIDWVASPADAVRLTPLTDGDDFYAVSIEFLQAGEVVITATGSDDLDSSDETDLVFSDTVEYQFTVLAAMTPNAGSTPPALTNNQRTALATLTRACQGGNDLPDPGDDLAATCSSLDLLADQTAALDRLVADELFAMGDALVLSAERQIDNVQARIIAVRAGQRKAFDVRGLNLQLWDQSVPGHVLALASDTDNASINSLLNDNAFGVFANGNIAVGEYDGDGIQRSADLSSSTLTLGADYRLSNNRIVGAALGIVSDDTEFAGDESDLSMQGFSLSAFATWYAQDKGYADIIIDISQNDFNLNRRIGLDSQPFEMAKSSTSATRFALSANVGRTIVRGATEFGPTARASIINASIDGFNEASSLADNTGSGTQLTVNSHKASSAQFAVGGELKHVINTRKAVLVPSVRLELAVDSKTDKGIITAAFTKDPGTNQMQFEGAERDNSALLLDVGTSAVFPHGQSAFIAIQTRLQDERVSQNELQLGYRMQF